MRAAAILRGLGPIDLASVRRDSLLRWMIAVPILVALVVRWGVPPFSRWLGAYQVDLAPYHPLIVSGVVMITPMLFGTVIGFLLLDQKDDQTLTALQVTPLTSRGYLGYRIGMPVLLGVVMTVVAIQLTGLSEVGLGRQLLASVLAAPLAPLFALFLATFARNKVQGFALMKGSGVVNWPPMIAWFVSSDWQYAFGFFPTYWPAKFYWQLEAGRTAAASTWVIFGVGLAYTTLLTVLLARRFDRVMHR